jgi:hypothetical protein
MSTPTNPRYTVALGSNGLLYINDKRLQSTRSYSPAEFVSGQMRHNTDTDDYPDYVHGLVWQLVDRSK